MRLDSSSGQNFQIVIVSKFGVPCGGASAVGAGGRFKSMPAQMG